MNPRLLEILLSPAAGIYWLIVYVRNWLFEKGHFKTQKFSVPIISVGNLSAGGTGKTPVVAFLTETMAAAGKKVVIVSRGYKGNYKGEAEQVDPLKPAAAAIYGDEPTWFAGKCQVPVFVGRKRVKAIELALSKEKPDFIIADDGFQHRWFERDQNVVLLDVTETSNLMIPAGRWREPFSSLKRATVILLTKTNLVSQDELSLWEELVADFGFFYQNGNLFKVDYHVQSIVRVHGNKELKEGEEIILGSSIARPGSFKTLLEKKYKVVRHWTLADHAHWSQLDIDNIEKFASHTNCPHFVLTEKDFVKMKGLEFIDLNLWVVRLGLEFKPDSKSFYKLITSPK